MRSVVFGICCAACLSGGDSRARAVIYKCPGHLRFKAVFGGAAGDGLLLEDSSHQRWNLRRTSELAGRKYENNSGNVIFVLDGRHRASLTVIDVLHNECTGEAPTWVLEK